MIILSSPHSDQHRIIETINKNTELRVLPDFYDPNYRTIYNDIVGSVDEAFKYFDVINITLYPHMLYDKDIENLLESFDDVIVLYRDDLLVQAALHAWVSKTLTSKMTDPVYINTDILTDCVNVLEEIKKYLFSLRPKAFVRSEELHLFGFKEILGIDIKLDKQTIDLSSIACNHEQLLGVSHG